MKRYGINKCLSESEMSQLFNDAFETWHTSAGKSDDTRQAPRIVAPDAKPLFVVSYAFDGQDFPVGQGASIADISADGLGIVLPNAVPLDAMLRFAFENPSGKNGTGVASVARVARHKDGYLIGLTFDERAVALSVNESSKSTIAAHWIEKHFGTVMDTTIRACRIATCRRKASRTLTRTIDGREARFVVDVKLFRYTATLHIDGRKEAVQTGTLRDRLLNLISDMALPTMIHLEGGGFSAWATLRPNAVLNCTLEQNVSASAIGFLRPIPKLPPAKPARRRTKKKQTSKAERVATTVA